MFDLMDRYNLAALLVGGQRGMFDSPIQYLSNWPPIVDSFLIFPRDGEPVLLVRLYNHWPNAIDISVIPDVRFLGNDMNLALSNLIATLSALNLAKQRIGLLGRIDYWQAQAIVDKLPSVEFVNVNRDYERLRLVKSREEIRFLYAASKMCDDAVAALAQAVRPGLKEYELSAIIEQAYNGRRGTTHFHFVVTTSMASPDRCVPRQYLSDRVIKSGDVLVTEISSNYWHYPGQILRTMTVAAPPTPLYENLHRVALQTYHDLLDYLRAGATLDGVFEVGRQIHAAGYSIYDDLIHGYGGGGYLSPVIRTAGTGGADVADFEFEADMVFIVQPNVITPDFKAGVQIGNMVRIVPGGVEVLNKYPTELIRCG